MPRTCGCAQGGLPIRACLPEFRRRLLPRASTIEIKEDRDCLGLILALKLGNGQVTTVARQDLYGRQGGRIAEAVSPRLVYKFHRRNLERNLFPWRLAVGRQILCRVRAGNGARLDRKR